MTNLINFMVEANLLLMVFWFIYLLTLRNDPNFQLRRFFILITLSTTLLIPLVSIGSFITPDWAGEPIAGLSEVMIILPELVIGGSQAVATSFSQGSWWTYLIVSIYGLISILMTLRLGTQLVTLANLITQSKQVKTTDYVLIKTSAYPTFSFFRYLVLNQSEQLTQTEEQQVLQHEKIHISQYHSVDIVLLEILKILFWYNPAIWAFKRLQTENHEFIADQEVLQHHEKDIYQSLIARTSIGSLMAYTNNFAQLKSLKRFKMMDSKRKSSFGLRQSIALGSMILTITFFACTDEGILEVAKTSSFALEIPPEAQEKIDKLQAELPGINFVYAEIDLPGGDKLTPDLLSRSEGMVQDHVIFEEREKAGLILVPNQQFSLLADLTKDENGVYSLAEEWPTPDGGIESFFGYVGRDLKYPARAREMGIEGKVFVEFIVNEIGEITNVTVLKGIGAGCDEAAAQVISKAANWTPGKLEGKSIKVRMVLPITFKLENS